MQRSTKMEVMPLILNLGARWCEWSAARYRALGTHWTECWV